ncbi:MAG: N-acetyltransferase [Rivularia sp. (in: Bacteria)]|nr:N-acetyltransferase [Rivularia sp. MS3]
MIIRHATEKDLHAIVAIYNASIPGRMATADLEPVSVMSRINWFRKRSPLKHPLWVIETGDIIAGWLSFQPFYGRPAYRATAEVSIYIATNYQKQGLGKRLLKEAIRQSPNLGLKTLIGFIFEHNEASLKLFEQFAFQRWGHMPGIADIDGIERGLVILGLRVG